MFLDTEAYMPLNENAILLGVVYKMVVINLLPSYIFFANIAPSHLIDSCKKILNGCIHPDP